MFGLEFNWISLTLSAGVTLTTLVFFLYDFCRKQDGLVDVI
jgi:hypothetical protein